MLAYNKGRLPRLVRISTAKKQNKIHPMSRGTIGNTIGGLLPYCLYKELRQQGGAADQVAAAMLVVPSIEVYRIGEVGRHERQNLKIGAWKRINTDVNIAARRPI